MSGYQTRPVDHDPFGPQLVPAPKKQAERAALVDTMRRMAAQSSDGNYRGALDQMEMAMFSSYPNRLLAVYEGKPVGAIAFGSPGTKEHSNIEIHHVGSIHPGVGRMLVEKAMERAVKEGKIVTLHSTEEAVSFYEKMGFFPRNEYADDPVMMFDPNGMGPGETWSPGMDREPQSQTQQQQNPQEQPSEEKEHPLVEGLRQAADGKWYLPNPDRPGKYLQIMEPASKGG